MAKFTFIFLRNQQWPDWKTTVPLQDVIKLGGWFSSRAHAGVFLDMESKTVL